MSIEKFVAHIPDELLDRSGKVFYSGRNAFSAGCPIYMLGINPGGSPDEGVGDTVERHTFEVLRKFPSDWSAYRDESWEGTTPGTYGMAPRVLHLLHRLGLNPGSVPASNLVFARSRLEADINRGEMRTMADACWSFHKAVIESLRPRVVLCFGATAGTYVRRQLGANSLIGEFVEDNNRQWRSRAFANDRGVNVVVGAHPSRADWCSAAADITPLVQVSLE